MRLPTVTACSKRGSPRSLPSRTFRGLLNRHSFGAWCRSCLLWAIISALLPMPGAQAVKQTSQTSVLLELGNGTATQLEPPLPTQSPVDVTLTYPTEGLEPGLPWILLMPSVNCYASDYGRVQQLLAEKGFLVIAADELHPVTSAPAILGANALAADREPQCSNTSFSAPTASIFGDIHSLLSHWTGQPSSVSAESNLWQLPAAAQAAVNSSNVSSAVIVGHAAGGRTPIDMVTGLCQDPAEFLCPNYTASSQVHDRSIIKGIIAWESPGIMMNDLTLDIPEGIFVTYLSGSNDSLASPTMDAFERTTGSCVSYVQLSSGNHFAITDWNPNSAPYQKAACARVRDTGDFQTPTTLEEQEERLLFIVGVADATIRSQVLRDSRAAEYLVDQLIDSPNVYMADLAPQCYDV